MDIFFYYKNALKSSKNGEARKNYDFGWVFLEGFSNSQEKSFQGHIFHTYTVITVYPRPLKAIKPDIKNVKDL